MPWIRKLMIGPIAAATLGGPLEGQQPSWAALQSRAAAGSRVIVTLTDCARLEGRVARIDPGSLTLTLERGPARHVAARDVARVTRADARRSRVLRYGIPVGALVGGITVLAIDSRSSNPEPGEAFAMGAALIGAPAGALVAAAVPVGPLYDAGPCRRP